jgi:hypothetical protein
VAGKHAALVLTSGGTATYDATTQRIVFPDDDKRNDDKRLGQGKPAVKFAAPSTKVVKAGVARPASSLDLDFHPSSTPLRITFHVDSGAGQSLCFCPDAFLDVRPCAIEVVGVSGSLPVFGVGTAVFVVQSKTDRAVVVLIHNCLLCQGSSFNLLSVSQFQFSPQHSVDFSTDTPSLTIRSSHGCVGIPLVLDDGLYSFVAEPIHPSDDRYRSCSRWDLTAKVSRDAAVRLPSSGESSACLGLAGANLWRYKLLAGTTLRHRILAFPVASMLSFAHFAMATWPPLRLPQHVALTTRPIRLTWLTCLLDSWAQATSACVGRLN